MEKTFFAKTEYIKEMIQFTSEALEKEDINENLAYEYKLLLEEIILKLVANAKETAELTIEVFNKLGGTNVKLSCPGKEVVLEAEDDVDYGGKIIEQYSEYLNQSFVAGVNYVTFASTKTKSNKGILLCALAVVLSAAVAFIAHITLSDDQISWLRYNIMETPVYAFARLLQTVATPVAFLSLVTSIMTIRLTISTDRKKRALMYRYSVTSVVALAFGTFTCVAYKAMGIYFSYDMSVSQTEPFSVGNFIEFFEQAIPKNLIEPFTSSNPLPLLILGLLLGITVTNFFGPSGEFARNTIRALDGLFVRVMDIVYNLLPIFLFFSLLLGWMEKGGSYALMLLKNLLLFLPPFLLLAGLYAIELLANGIRPSAFLKEYKGMIAENFKIGSNIHAMPYNRRTIFKKTKMPLSDLESGLKLGSIMNMDGNCVIIATGIVGMIFANDIQMDLVQIIFLVLIVILLSIGSPNQSGSFVICMAVLLSFIGFADNGFYEILITEAFYGRIYSCANAVGDIVEMVIEAKRIKEARE